MGKRGIPAGTPDIDEDFLKGQHHVVEGFGRGTQGVAKGLVVLMVILLAVFVFSSLVHGL